MAESPAPHRPLAAWLDRRMNDLGMSQAELARRAGTGDVQVGRWRRGEATPTPRFLAKLAAVFGVELAELERLAYLPDSNPQPASEQVDAERRLYRARYDYLMAEKIPRPFWESFLAACEALADVFTDSARGAINTPERPTISSSSSEKEEGNSGGSLGGLTRSYRPHSSTYRSTSLSRAAAAT